MPGPGLKDRVLRAWKDRPRRHQMIVTDVTRMEGERVCVGGYLEERSDAVVRHAHDGVPGSQLHSDLARRGRGRV